jgi:uncharacterized ferredoxin-like protein
MQKAGALYVDGESTQFLDLLNADVIILIPLSVTG